MPKILVPGDLVCRSRSELSKLAGWKRHPRTSLKELIYGLNTIFDRHQFIKYRHSFPKPSVAVRELERIRALCKKAEKSRNCAPVMERIEALTKRNTDSYGLLLFQAARTIDKREPERAINDGRARELLREVARIRPRQLAVMSDRALKGLRGLTTHGRGGNRNRGAQNKQNLILDLGILYENVTGRRPTVTRNPSDSTYSGPFPRFAIAVFKTLDLRTNARQVDHYLKTIRNKSKVK